MLTLNLDIFLSLDKKSSPAFKICSILSIAGFFEFDIFEELTSWTVLLFWILLILVCGKVALFKKFCISFFFLALGSFDPGTV